MISCTLTDYQIDTCDKVLNYLFKHSNEIQKIWFEFDSRTTPEIHFLKCISYLKGKGFISEPDVGVYKLTLTGKAFIIDGGFQTAKIIS